MKVLVTGASGFLGQFLCHALRARGSEVFAADSKNCNLTRSNAFDNFSGQRFDQIYHLAAWTQAGEFCLSHQGEQWIINQEINTRVLSWWQKKQPQAKLVSIGTSCAYDPNLPLVETNYLKGEPIEGLYTYAMTKRMLYAGLLALNRQFDLEYLVVIPSTLYGANYHTDGRQMHFIFDLIRKILRAKYYKEVAVLWGDGYQKRELVYVDDFVQMTLQLNDECKNDIFNIGYGNEYTIREFALSICNLVDYDFDLIQFDKTKYVGARSKCLNVEKLRDSVGIQNVTALNEGLNKTILWFKRNYFQKPREMASTI